MMDFINWILGVFKWLASFVGELNAQRPPPEVPPPPPPASAPAPVPPVAPGPAPAPKPKPKYPTAHEGTLEWYEQAWDFCDLDPGTESRVRAAAAVVLSGRSRYEAVERVIEVPWWWTGGSFHMECGCKFNCAMHNGDPIIGTGKKTYNVPAGRGPFSTWEQSAFDALRAIAHLKTWSIEEALRRAEQFNGWGYVTGAGRQDTSPYLWSCTNINDGTGKYTSDGSYNPNVNSNGQVGFAAILKQLEKDGHITVTRYRDRVTVPTQSLA